MLKLDIWLLKVRPPHRIETLGIIFVARRHHISEGSRRELHSSGNLSTGTLTDSFVEAKQLSRASVVSDYDESLILRASKRGYRLWM